jgi:hypothetical protein
MKELDLLKKIGKSDNSSNIETEIYKMIHKIFDCEVDFDNKHFGSFIVDLFEFLF